MSNNKKISVSIRDMKKHISDLRYLLESIVTLPKDKKSFKNLLSAKMVLMEAQRIINNEFNDLEKTIESNISTEQSESFRNRLATVNSPSKKMQKVAEDFIDGHKNFNTLVKKSLSDMRLKVGKDENKNITSRNG